MKHRNMTARQARAAERGLMEAIACIRSADEARSFLNDLCTPAELEALADRWAVVEPLAAGLPYREIHDRTGVSVTTIGRVARFLVAGNGGYRNVLARLRRARD